jgi:putative membrane protein
MILRDYLALDRTVLANERTLLAYLRTFIGTFSAGLAMVKLLDTSLTTIIGYVFAAVSPLFIVLGAVRYIQTGRKLKTIETIDDTDDETIGDTIDETIDESEKEYK